MLKVGSKPLFWIAVVLLCFVSCTSKTDKNVKKYAIEFEKLVNDEEYKTVMRSVTDTIQNWIKLDLKYFHLFKTEYVWQIDDWIYFNSTKNQCIVNILIRNFYNPKLDDVYIILGEKQQGKWWFYDGPDLKIIQETYTDDKTLLALPFDQIRIVARKYTLGWYYTKGAQGNYTINDSVFESEFSYRSSFELRQKEHREFFKKKYTAP